MWKKQMIVSFQHSSSSSRNRVTKRHRDESDDERRATDRKPSGQVKRRKYNEDHLRLLQSHKVRQFRTASLLKREKKSLREENEEMRLQLQEASKKEHRFRITINQLMRKIDVLEETVREKTEEVSDLRAGLAAKQAKADYFHNVLLNLRESIVRQFTCSVCTEVLIKAHTLRCGHTFCSYCLQEWERQNPSCPICRAAIRCKHPARLVDEHINSLIEEFYSDEAQNTRSNLVQERIRLQEERAQDPQPQRALGDPINIILREELDQIPRTVQMYIMTRVFDEQMRDYLNQINPAAGQEDEEEEVELSSPPRSRTSSSSSTDSDATVVLSESDLESANDFQPF